MPGPGLIKFKYSPAGYKAILRSPGVVADLDRRARRVRAAVAARSVGAGWVVISNVRVGRTRARAIVSGVPERVEIADRILGNAIDAAR